MSFNDVSRKSPTLIGVPCFAGAVWDLPALTGLQGYDVRLLRLPDGDADLDAAVDAVLASAPVDGDFVVAGDSFGAAVTLALALRHPPGLVGIVLSGGFAVDPTPRWKSAVAAGAAWFPAFAYREVVLRFHAEQLRSRFDETAEVPHTPADYRRLFALHTPKASYASRLRAVRAFDVRDRLAQIDVPTLLITPEDDRLVGEDAGRALAEGLPHADEVVLPGTGHMFRFTHPARYSDTIARFLHTLTPAA